MKKTKNWNVNFHWISRWISEFGCEFGDDFSVNLGWFFFPVVGVIFLGRHFLDFSSLGGLFHFAPPKGPVSWMLLASWQNQENQCENEGPKNSPRIHPKFTSKFIPKFTQNSPLNSQPNLAWQSQNSTKIHCADISAQATGSCGNACITTRAMRFATHLKPYYADCT